MEKSEWNKADKNGTIDVPDYLDNLINYVGNQIRFHTISGKNEVQTVCDIVKKSEEFFDEHYKPVLEALQKLYGLLEEHQPIWYLRGHHDKAKQAIQKATQL